MYYYGHEENVVNFVKKIVEKNTVFVDVGAFIGFYSILAGKRGSTVYSFEPDPRSYILLKINALLTGLNSKIHADNMAVGDKEGYVLLKLASTYADSSITDYIPSNRIINTIKVPIITIDHFVKEQNINNVDIIKIDVEGYGAKVINGAVNTIKMFKPKIIIEIHRFNNDEELKKVLEIKETFGYNLNIIEYRNTRNFIIYLE